MLCDPTWDLTHQCNTCLDREFCGLQVALVIFSGDVGSGSPVQSRWSTRHQDTKRITPLFLCYSCSSNKEQNLRSVQVFHLRSLVAGSHHVSLQFDTQLGHRRMKGVRQQAEIPQVSILQLKFPARILRSTSFYVMTKLCTQYFVDTTRPWISHNAPLPDNKIVIRDEIFQLLLTSLNI